MKKIISIIAIAISLSLPLVLSAQQPPHPNGDVTPTDDSKRVGHGPSAPIGSGTIILTLLAAAYGGKKVYNLRKEDKE